MAKLLISKGGRKHNGQETVQCPKLVPATIKNAYPAVLPRHCSSRPLLAEPNYLVLKNLPVRKLLALNHEQQTNTNVFNAVALLMQYQDADISLQKSLDAPTEIRGPRAWMVRIAGWHHWL